MTPMQFIVNQGCPETRQQIISQLGLSFKEPPNPDRVPRVQPDSPITLEKMEMAIALRKEGVMWREIGLQLGHSGKGIQAALRNRYERLKHAKHK